MTLGSSTRFLGPGSWRYDPEKGSFWTFLTGRISGSVGVRNLIFFCGGALHKESPFHGSDARTAWQSEFFRHDMSFWVNHHTVLGGGLGCSPESISL